MSAGVCTDSLYHPITPSMLKRLTVENVRVEIRAEQQFIDYVIDLDSAGIELAYLVGPSSPQDSDLQKVLALCPPPKYMIIGNEPDIIGDSSWTMKHEEFIALWNDTIAIVKNLFTSAILVAPGTYSPEYMKTVWDKLEVKPAMLNRHYPDDAEDIIVYTKYFKIPTIVGETCYKTATLEQMVDWVYLLNRYASVYYWFVANEANHENMGLLSVRDYPTRAFYNYRNAIKTI